MKYMMEKHTDKKTGWNITGNPAVLSRVNGGRRSSAEAWNFNDLPKPHLLIWIGWLRHTVRQPCQVLVKIVSAVAPPHGGEIKPRYLGNQA